MPKNKNQHYIPRLLLKRWVTPAHAGMRVYRFRRGATSCEAVGLSQAGSAPYFYRDGIDPQRPDRLDDLLNHTERRIGPVLEQIITTRRFPHRNTVEYDTLIRFIHDLYIRTPAVRAMLEAAPPEEMTRTIASAHLAQDPSLVEEALAIMASGSPEEQYRRELYLQATGRAEKLTEASQRILHYKAVEHLRTRVLEYLNLRAWRLLLAPQPGPYFVLGDEPLVIHDSNAKVNTGLAHRKSQVSIPLSPTVALQGFQEHVRDIKQLDAAQVRQLNCVFLRSAHKEVFANTEDFTWQRKLGKVYTSREWMNGIPEAIWPSNLSG